jgi:hypothetical protein
VSGCELVLTLSGREVDDTNFPRTSVESFPTSLNRYGRDKPR